ncbi:MAG: SpoIIIAH-like family protein [Firmicutes bacterium]|nr:SpoIIIAH-like family protein [Bacillota bacterium]
MINKQNLWFITLFSLIMVLSIYYLSMSNDTLSTLNVSSTNNEATELVISESDTLVALKVAEEEAYVAKLEELQNILLSNTSSLQEKNDAYNELQNMNKNESKKEEIEKIIKENYKLDSVVSINGTNIKITVASKTHDSKLANNIIRSIQSLYDTNMYITVKFDN